MSNFLPSTSSRFSTPFCTSHSRPSSCCTVYCSIHFNSVNSLIPRPLDSECGFTNQMFPPRCSSYCASLLSSLRSTFNARCINPTLYGTAIACVASPSDSLTHSF